MPFYKFLVDEPNIVLLNIPAGKSYFSNPSTYFKQASQKGGTCWFYSLRLIQPRIGKDEKFQALPERIIEKQSSTMRKQLTANEIKHDREKAIISRLEEEKPNLVFNHKTVADFQYTLKELIRLNIIDINEELKTELELYEDFLTQGIYDDLKLFSKSKQINNEIKILKAFLDNFNFDVVERIMSFNAEFHPDINTAKLLSSNDIDSLKILKKTLLDLTIATLCNGYGIQIAKWVPSDNVEKLMQVIKEKGPLVVGGDVGTPFCERSEDIGNIENYKLKSWEPAVNLFTSSTHCVVIVGASKGENGEDSIYFIDPNDESMPNQPRTIYKSNYYDFCKSLRNLYGDKVNKSLYLNQGKYDFAYYGNLNQLNDFRIMNEVLVDVSFEESPSNINEQHLINFESEEGSLNVDEFSESLESFLETTDEGKIKNEDEDKLKNEAEEFTQVQKKRRFK